MDINVAGAVLRSITADAAGVHLIVDPTGPEALVSIDGRQVTGSINGQPAHMVTQERPQSALEGAVKPNQTAGSTNAPQAGSTAGASGGFSLGEGAPDASNNIIVPWGSGEFRIDRDGPGAINVGFDVPADANVSARRPGSLKFRSEGDKLWGIATLSQEPGYIAQSDRDNGPSASLGLAYVTQPGTALQQLEPGGRYWLNVDKMFVGTLVFQHTLPS